MGELSVVWREKMANQLQQSEAVKKKELELQAPAPSDKGHP